MAKRKKKRTIKRRRPVRRRAVKRAASRKPTRRRARRNPAMFSPVVATSLTVGAGYVAAQYLDSSAIGAQISAAIPGERQISASTAIGIAFVAAGVFTKLGQARTRRTLTAAGVGMLIKPASELITGAVQGGMIAEKRVIAPVRPRVVAPRKLTPSAVVAQSEALSDYA